MIHLNKCDWILLLMYRLGGNIRENSINCFINYNFGSFNNTSYEARGKGCRSYKCFEWFI